MKKLVFGIAVALILSGGMIAGYHATQTQNLVSGLVKAGIEALSAGETPGSGGTSCTVTSTCYDLGKPSGSVSCTGTKCERSNGGWNTEPWVKCDGVKTSC